MDHSSTSTYISNLIKSKKLFVVGWMDGRTDWRRTSETHFIRSTRRSGPKKGKGFPYPLPRVVPGADPSVEAVSPQVTISYPPGGRLSLLPARPVVTFPATKHHRPLADTKLYCLVTEALAQGCYAALYRVGFKPTTC